MSNVFELEKLGNLEIKGSLGWLRIMRPGSGKLVMNAFTVVDGKPTQTLNNLERALKVMQIGEKLTGQILPLAMNAIASYYFSEMTNSEADQEAKRQSLPLAKTCGQG